MACDMVEEENGDVLGAVRCGARDEVGMFSQAANNDIDAIMFTDGGDDGVVRVDGEVLPVEVRAPNFEGVDHDEEFLLVGGVVHLRRKELLASEGDGVLVGWSLGVGGGIFDGGGFKGVAREVLGWDGSKREFGCVSGNVEMLRGVGDLEDGGRGDGLFEEVEGVLAAVVPSEGFVLAGAFAELGVEFLLFEDREDLAEMLKVGLEGGPVDKDTIKVNNVTDFEEVAKDVVHGGLECGGAVGEFEGRHEKLVVPKARTECGLVGVLLADADLVEATAEVNFGKIFGSMETIKKLGDPRWGVLVPDRDPVIRFKAR
ncbi:hypothetical protein CBR_g67074 [Chara braunii]|uniref:Uncharacterized protein n=1 Tax=Chara braunii TaxID=69332 RepID=A0A388MFM9_CHABU|nr:hypothetical protein CBR_g67074 [Chara braunii]|eukprot:GBG93366.1 hypothetical protein CBR_g67074 [Chara braunii]